jgi:membrane protein
MCFAREKVACRRRANWGFPYFIARRLQLSGKAAHRMSKPFLSIATIAVAISVGAMLVAVSVARGFQAEIASRATMFVGHVQVVNLDGNASLEQIPIERNGFLYDRLLEIPSLRSAFPFVLKGGVIKTSESMQGCIVKGVDGSMDWSLMQPFIARGRVPNFRDPAGYRETIISEAIAERLDLDTGQRLTVYFVQNPPRVRQMDIVGVYSTQLTDFDARYIFAHMVHLQRVNGWDSTQIGGYEVHARGMADADAAVASAVEAVDENLEREGKLLRVVDMRDRYASLFGWLDLMDVNVVVLLTVLLAVAGVNMITAMLILILERTRMVGLLKALGARGRQLRAIFIMQAVYILLRGLLIGNAVGLALLAAQRRWAVVRLNPEDYYIDRVPVSLSVALVVAVNAITSAVTVAMMLGPSAIVARMNAGESVRFE